jgi:predicted acetyltransferase
MAPLSVEIRAARPEEMDEFGHLLSYAFASPPPGAPDAPPGTVAPEWTTCAFVDGRMAVATGAYPFNMRLNGGRIGAAGLTAVGAYPEFRRQGLLRRVMERGLAEQRERGQSVAILWASFGAIYQRFGYGLGSSVVRYRFDPRLVAFRENLPLTGSVGLLPKDEALEIIQPLYVAYSRPRNLMLHRAPLYWEAGIFTELQNRRPYVAVYRNGAGEPRGYIVYRTRGEKTKDPGPNHLMEVRDFVALDVEAYRSLWAYIRKHDLVRWVEMVVPPDDPAPHLLLEPRELRAQTSDGIWLRVVDVERALPQRPYGERGSLAFEIADDLCEWNVGRFLLETDGEGAELKRTERAAELSMPVRTLATLIAGQATASQLARAGLLGVRDPSALRRADRIFATEYPPFCPDVF